MIKSSIVWQKPWSNTFGKFQFLDISKTSFFLSIKHSCLPRILKKRSFLARLAKKIIDYKKLDFLKKTMDQPLLKNSMFWTFLKLTFSGLKSLLCYKEYKKRSFLNLFAKKIYVIKRLILWQNLGLTLLENFNFLDSFRTLFFRTKKLSLLLRI